MKIEGFVLRLSKQRADSFYHCKYALQSFSKNSPEILVTSAVPNFSEVGLCIGVDRVVLIKRPSVKWDALCILIGENRYYVMPNEFEPIEKDEDE